MKGIPKLAWVGLAVLCLAATLLALGRRETQSFPAADSFAPSGAAAFFELLKSQGYKVEIDRNLRPKLKPHDVVIAFQVATPPNLLEEIQQEVEDEGDRQPEYDKPFNKELIAHLNEGGRALFLPLSRDFPTASKALLGQSTVLRPATKNAPLTVTFGGTPTTLNAFAQEIADREPYVDLWQSSGDASVLGLKVGRGTVFLPWTGMIATNRFIDQKDNAQLLLDMVAVLAPKGTRIVFTEAAFGNAESKGLLQAIGAWADAAWQQLLLLGLVVAYTLGKRLGLPQESKGRQRGSRELLDALADTMMRSRSTKLAIATALKRCDDELRIALKLPQDTDRKKRDELLPADLQKAFILLQVSMEDPNTPAWDAARKVKKLDAEMTAFLGTKRRRPSGRAKMTQ